MKKSAGILLYRIKNNRPEFFLVHPGGPFFRRKDAGVWTIPKGEADEDERLFDAAKREFYEETGRKADGNFIELSPVKQKNGKWVFAWAVEGDMDPEKLVSNTFTVEWPPKSGKTALFPEIDQGDWFDYETARLKIIPAQISFLEEVVGKTGK